MSFSDQVAFSMQFPEADRRIKELEGGLARLSDLVQELLCQEPNPNGGGQCERPAGHKGAIHSSSGRLQKQRSV